VTASAPEGELAAAAVSEWTTRVVAFTRWVGTGRRLTQTGRLTLGHARELVELLGTGDVVDPRVGDRVRRTKSSEELPELNTIFEWARAARLVRVAGGRLMMVTKNAALLERPQPLWERTFGALGPAICPPGGASPCCAATSPKGWGAVLSAIYIYDGPPSLAQACTWGWEAAIRGYRISGVTESQRDVWRRCNDRDVRRALDVLARFGAVRIDGPREAPSDPDPAGASRDASRVGRTRTGAPLVPR
jgi:hypothetical protein